MVRELFKICIGASRIEFSVGIKGYQYVGLVNNIPFIYGSDYEEVRDKVLESLSDKECLI